MNTLLLVNINPICKDSLKDEYMFYLLIFILCSYKNSCSSELAYNFCVLLLIYLMNYSLRFKLHSWYSPQKKNEIILLIAARYVTELRRLNPAKIITQGVNKSNASWKIKIYFRKYRLLYYHLSQQRSSDTFIKSDLAKIVTNNLN